MAGNIHTRLLEKQNMRTQTFSQMRMLLSTSDTKQKETFTPRLNRYPKNKHLKIGNKNLNQQLQVQNRNRFKKDSEIRVE